MFLDDLQKMGDFFIMSKEEFLSINRDETSISYELTKDYYNINKMFFIEKLEEKLNKLVETCANVYKKIANVEIACHSGSTDCNIPMSLGIPSVAIGVRNGGGVHTREEFLEIDSLPLGFELAINVMKEFLK